MAKRLLVRSSFRSERRPANVRLARCESSVSRWPLMQRGPSGPPVCTQPDGPDPSRQSDDGGCETCRTESAPGPSCGTPSTCPSRPAESEPSFWGPGRERTDPDRLRSVPAPDPDRAPSFQVTHHNAIGVALIDRQLIHADNLWCWLGRLGQPGLHVPPIQVLCRCDS